MGRSSSLTVLRSQDCCTLGGGFSNGSAGRRCTQGLRHMDPYAGGGSPQKRIQWAVRHSSRSTCQQQQQQREPLVECGEPPDGWSQRRAAQLSIALRLQPADNSQLTLRELRGNFKRHSAASSQGAQDSRARERAKSCARSPSLTSQPAARACSLTSETR